MIYLGYRTPTVKDLTMEEKVKLAKELSMKAVELGFNDIKTDEEAVKWKELKAQYGVGISTLGLGLELCDPQKKQENLEKLENGIRRAKIIGIDTVFTRTGNAPPDIPQPETWRTCIDMTVDYAEVCAQNGIKAAIEVDPPCFVDNLERVVFLFEQVNHPNLYLNYDPTNFYVRGSNPVTVIKRLKHLMVGGHIKDAIYRFDCKKEVKIGEGEVDYKEIFTRLKEENIELTMHIEHAKSAQEVIDGCRYISGVLKTVF